MASNGNIQWDRITVEAIAIVASILLAFSIDAWWEDRQDRAEEVRVLQALAAEFSANADRLAHYARSHDITVDAIDTLLAALRKADQDNPAIVPEPDVLNVTFHLTFDPVTGAFDAMMQSGALRLIQNPAIREMLAAWPARINDATENEGMLRTLTGPRLNEVLMRQVDLELIRELFECRDERTMEVCARGDVALRPTLELFGNLAVVKGWANQAARELELAEVVARDIIQQIDDELARLQ